MNEPAVSTFGLECRDWNVEPVQQILVKLTNHNEAWITQLPYLCGHNVRYRAGLDKCGRSVTVNTIRLHMGTAHMACDPGRGGHHDQKGGIGNIIVEASEGGRAYARGAGDIVQRSR